MMIQPHICHQNNVLTFRTVYTKRREEKRGEEVKRREKRRREE